jgi:glutathione S-transferase
VTLKLYMHPLSSYCHKALIALYENRIPFEPRQLDNATVYGEFKKMWPIGRFPLLRDDARDTTVPESSSIIEYLALHYPGSVKLLPDDPDLARQVRMRDRFFDNYLHTPLQKFPADRLRPQEQRDPFGLNEARTMYRTALDMLDAEMSHKRWAMGDDFTMADCAAAPALFFGNRFFGPFHETHRNAMAYLERLMARPSYARALHEAEPYMHLVPT